MKSEENISIMHDEFLQVYDLREKRYLENADMTKVSSRWQQIFYLTGQNLYF